MKKNNLMNKSFYRLIFCLIGLSIAGLSCAHKKASQSDQADAKNAEVSGDKNLSLKQQPPVPILPGTPIDRMEAVVNSEIILRSDVEKFRKTIKLRAQLDPLFTGTSLSEKGASASDLEIVDFLIHEKLITQQFPISDAEVEQEINLIQSNNKIERAALKAALAEQGFKFEDYHELIRISISKRNLIDREIRPKVTISEDDIKNHYYNHFTRNSKAPRAFNLQLISVTIKNYKKPKDAFDAAHQTLKDIQGGESFEEAAMRVSDHDTASSGGELGVLSEDQISPTIHNHVKNLQIGEMKLFEESGKIYIVKLKDVQSNDTEHLSKSKDEIRNQLTAKEFQHQIVLWQDRQRQSAFVHRTGESIVKELASP